MASFGSKLRAPLRVRGLMAAVSVPQQLPLHTATCCSLTLSTGKAPVPDAEQQPKTAIRLTTSTHVPHGGGYIRMLPPTSSPWQTRAFSTSTSPSPSTPFTNPTTSTTLTAKCQCGTTSFSLPRSHLQSIYHCHCTECQKQSASAFGTSAVFSPASDVFPLSPALREKLQCWTRPTNEGRTMDCYFCKECGVRMVHRIIEADGTARSTVIVKGGVLEGLGKEDWKGAKHIYVGRAGVEILDGVEVWEGAPERMEGRPAMTKNEESEMVGLDDDGERGKRN